jgi:hypothetical protein
VSTPQGVNPNQHDGEAGALLGQLQAKAVLVWEAVDERLSPVRAGVAAHLRSLADSVSRALTVIAGIPGVLYGRAVRVARTLAEGLYFVFVTVPLWFVRELPRRTLAVLRAIGAFFSNEVVPTAEFFVEVPPALVGATLRDLFIRTPLWLVVRGPAAFVDLAKAAGNELLALLAAMFDRARGLVYRLIDGALFVWDTIQGGLRWIVVLLFIQFAPWLIHLGFDVFDQVLLIANSVVILIVATRRWLWQTILDLPRLLSALVEATVRYIEAGLRALVNFCFEVLRLLEESLRALVQRLRWFIRALPYLAQVLLRITGELLNFLLIQIPLKLARTLWELTIKVLRAVFIDLPKYLWELTVKVLRAVFIDLPKYLWDSTVAFARAVWSFGVALIEFATRLPGYAWQLVVFVCVTLPKETVRACVEVVRGLWRLVADVAKALAEPTMTMLTWTLALVIAPFYFLARLLGLGDSGRMSGHGR